MTYKERHPSLPEIAEELDVRWILEAAMMHAGRHVRVTAQLVEGASNENHWADGYTRRSQDLLDAQSQIAATVAAAVEAAVMTHPAAPPAAGMPVACQQSTSQ